MGAPITRRAAARDAGPGRARAGAVALGANRMDEELTIRMLASEVLAGLGCLPVWAAWRSKQKAGHHPTCRRGCALPAYGRH